MKENGGMVFSMEIMLAIVVITVIIAISADALDISSGRFYRISESHSVDIIANEAANILITTPGSPCNWEEYDVDTLNDINPGLSAIDKDKCSMNNVLDIKKIEKLREAYPKLIPGRILPLEMHSSIILYPLNQDLATIKVNEVNNSNIKEVYVVNRTVSVKMTTWKPLVTINIKKIIEEDNYGEKCTHNGFFSDVHYKPDFHLNHEGWICRQIHITPSDMDNYDFYIFQEGLILDETTFWFMDQPDNIKSEKHTFSSAPICINENIKKILDEKGEGVIWFHIHFPAGINESSKVYVVAIPRGTSSDMLKTEYLTPQPYYFVLKVWY